MSSHEETALVPARAEHLDALVEIDAATLRSKAARGNYERELERPGSELHLLLEGGRPVAFINYWVVLDEVHLLSLATLTPQRRKGYGRRLMNHLVSDARARGARVVTLEVRRSNRAAISLYEKFGFEIVSVRSSYYREGGEDALVMVLELLRDV